MESETQVTKTESVDDDSSKLLLEIKKLKAREKKYKQRIEEYKQREAILTTTIREKNNTIKELQVLLFLLYSLFSCIVLFPNSIHKYISLNPLYSTFPGSE